MSAVRARLGIAGGDVGDQAGPRRSSRIVENASAMPRHHARTFRDWRRPSAFCTLITSLSPRPDRLTSRMRPVGIVGASAAGVRHRVRRLERRDDALLARQPLKRVERALVVDPGVFGAPGVAEPRVLGADRGVVEAGGNRVRQLDVAVLVLQHEAARALQHAGAAAGEARRVLARPDAVAAGLDADQARRRDRR